MLFNYAVDKSAGRGGGAELIATSLHYNLYTVRSVCSLGGSSRDASC